VIALKINSPISQANMFAITRRKIQNISRASHIKNANIAVKMNIASVGMVAMNNPAKTIITSDLTL
jgi:hypothetical protein